MRSVPQGERDRGRGDVSDIGISEADEGSAGDFRNRPEGASESLSSLTSVWQRHRLDGALLHDTRRRDDLQEVSLFADIADDRFFTQMPVSGSSDSADIRNLSSLSISMKRLACT